VAFTHNTVPVMIAIPVLKICLLFITRPPSV
jgi:hypothetical protein